MAFDKKPSTWLGPGYAGDSTNHLIKLNTNDASSNKLLAQLTDVLADPTTGDIRVVAFALMESLYQAWVAQAAADRPKKMTINRVPIRNASGGLTYQYVFRFAVSPSGAYSVPSE